MILCPFCHRANRDRAKVCGYCGQRLPQTPVPSSPPTAPAAPPPAPAGRRFLSGAVVGGCSILFLMALIGAVGGALYGLNREAFLATPTALARAMPTPTVTTGPLATPSLAETNTATPPSPVPLATAISTLPPVAGPKRFNPVGRANGGVTITDLNSGAQYSFFASPGSISGSVLSAAWSPDGKQVLLSYNWNSDVYDYGHAVQVVGEDGTTGMDIVRTGPSKEGVMAALAYRDAIWSPDAKKVAVRYQYGNDFGIWLFNSDGTSKQRLATSHIGDWPRFWSVDGKWVIGVSSSDNLLYAEEIDGSRRVPFVEIKGIKMYDERYYPWRVIQDPACHVTGAWFYSGGAYWDCQ